MESDLLLPSRPGREIAIHHCEPTICTKEEQVNESVLLPWSSTSAGLSCGHAGKIIPRVTETLHDLLVDTLSQGSTN